MKDILYSFWSSLGGFFPLRRTTPVFSLDALSLCESLAASSPEEPGESLLFCILKLAESRTWRIDLDFGLCPFRGPVPPPPLFSESEPDSESDPVLDPLPLRFVL